LFVFSVLAVDTPGDLDDFFWVDFSFYPDNVKIEFGATHVKTSLCGALFREITRLNTGSIVSHKEAFYLIKKMVQKLKKDKDAYRKIFEQY